MRFNAVATWHQKSYINERKMTVIFLTNIVSAWELFLFSSNIEGVDYVCSLLNITI
jgi:hypothetical protein